MEKTSTGNRNGWRSINEIVANLSRPLSDKLLKTRFARDKRTGQEVEIKYLPWHTATRILDHYAPG